MNIHRINWICSTKAMAKAGIALPKTRFGVQRGLRQGRRRQGDLSGLHF